MIRSAAKQLMNQSPSLKAAFMLIDDFRWGRRLRSGRIDSDSGTIHNELPVAESVRYIEEVFADYKHYGKLAAFTGLAAEVGPGDNAGVALLMRRDGCQEVHLIDRYFSRRDSNKQRKVYDALSEKYQLGWLRTGQTWNDQTLAGIVPKIGQAAEKYFEEYAASDGPRYDVIVSRSVLEHLYDPIGALDHMVRCLKPRGRLLHKIDMRDHALFTPEHHELTFLKFPRRLYWLMTRHSGRPNRILFHRYREQLERLKKQAGIDYSAYITRLVGVGELTPHLLYQDVPAALWQQAAQSVDRYRSGFAREFKQIESADLAITGVFVVLTKS